MLKRTSTLVLMSALALSLGACASQTVDRTELKTKPHFWQRVDTTDAIYQRGPKAQQMLNRDISRCVTELRELERLSAIRYVTPGALKQGKAPAPDTPAGELSRWDTPERDGYLRAEHLPYHDFETCMQASGWERIEHVPYDVADQARDVYIETITGERYQTRTRKRKSTVRASKGDFDNLND